MGPSVVQLQSAADDPFPSVLLRDMPENHIDTWSQHNVSVMIGASLTLGTCSRRKRGGRSPVGHWAHIAECLGCTSGIAGHSGIVWPSVEEDRCAFHQRVG